MHAWLMILGPMFADGMIEWFVRQEPRQRAARMAVASLLLLGAIAVAWHAARDSSTPPSTASAPPITLTGWQRLGTWEPSPDLAWLAVVIAALALAECARRPTRSTLGVASHFGALTLAAAALAALGAPSPFVIAVAIGLADTTLALTSCRSAACPPVAFPGAPRHSLGIGQLLLGNGLVLLAALLMMHSTFDGTPQPAGDVSVGAPLASAVQVLILAGLWLRAGLFPVCGIWNRVFAARYPLGPSGILLLLAPLILLGRLSEISVATAGIESLANGAIGLSIGGGLLLTCQAWFERNPRRGLIYLVAGQTGWSVAGFWSGLAPDQAASASTGLFHVTATLIPLVGWLEFASPDSLCRGQDKRNTWLIWLFGAALLGLPPTGGFASRLALIQALWIQTPWLGIIYFANLMVGWIVIYRLLNMPIDAAAPTAALTASPGAAPATLPTPAFTSSTTAASACSLTMSALVLLLLCLWLGLMPPTG